MPGQEQLHQPDIEQAQQHRVADKWHQREPAVQRDHEAPGGRVRVKPPVQGMIVFCGQKGPSASGQNEIRNRCPDSFPHRRAPVWNPCAGTAGGAGGLLLRLPKVTQGMFFSRVRATISRMRPGR